MDLGSSRQNLGRETQQEENFITILLYPTASKKCYFIPSFILIRMNG